MPYGSLSVDTLQSSTAGTPPQFNDGNGTQVGTLCRAWVNFNGTTSPGTIRASFNVGSVTKNSTGNYTINFTTVMSDANYAATGMCNDNGNTTSIMYRTGGLFSTTQLQVSTGAGGGLADNANCLVAVFR